MDLSVGQELGIYKLVSRIGAGGMGEVWKAEDTRLGRVVAIKILPKALAADEESKARLLREARTAAQLNHPNIAMIHSIDHVEDRWFIVMEYVEGQSLKSLIGSGTLSEADVCRYGREISDALSAAHEKSIVHRDIKPDNVIITSERVKVLDFGIAKQIGATGDPGQFVTQTGVVMGTVHYMSPEQARGQELDGRTDIYSLGILLFEAATGQLPFHGDSVTEVLAQIIRDEAPKATTVRQTLSPQLSAVIERCLRKDRESRYASASELSRALGQAEAFVSTQRSARVDEIPPTAKIAVAAETVTTKRPEAQRSRSWMGWVVMLLVLVAVVVVGSTVMKTRQKANAPPPVTVPAEKPTPPPAKTNEVDSAATTPVIIEDSAENTPDGQETAPATQGTEASETVDVTESAPAQGMPNAPEERGHPEPASQPAPPSLHEGSPGRGDRSAEDVFNEGVRLMVDGEGGKAAERFETAVRIDPGYGPAHLKLGEILVIRGNQMLAAVEFERALRGHGLSEREQSLSRLYLARIRGRQLEFEKLIREHQQRWPNDPELEAVKREVEKRRPFRPGSRKDPP